MHNENIRVALDDWFKKAGAYVLVDGQFGSTGKGLIASALAECFWPRVQCVVSNAGPNSGHTSYYGDEQIILKQLPSFSVTARKVSHYTDRIHTVLDAGAIIDPEILVKEIEKHKLEFISIHPYAALIDTRMRMQDKRTVKDIASTGQGVGPAQAHKIRRHPEAIFRHYFSSKTTSSTYLALLNIYPTALHNKICFFEVSQGFSLGINSGFYPHVTSRECTVSQALSDAGMPPTFHQKTIMSLRTYPIRVGHTVNTSGPVYSDQDELTWADLRVKPEMTTVTKRVRRVFTWSNIQFKEALIANAPDILFINFMNYLSTSKIEPFIKNIMDIYYKTLYKFPDAVLLGYGPRSSDIKVWPHSL